MAALSSDFYERSDVTSALTQYDFGGFFKLLRRELRLTQEGLGTLVGVAQSRICKVENGQLRLRDVETVARIAATVRIPADLLGFTPDSVVDGEANDTGEAVSWMHRRDFISVVTATALGAGVGGAIHDRLAALVPDISVDSPRRVGIADVERIEATTQALRDWNYRWGGGGISLDAVVAQLRWAIATTKTAASGSVHRRLLVATADLANLGAWTSYDVERHEDARRLWMVALDAAKEADNPDLGGTILRLLAHQALHLQRPHEALRLVRLAFATATDPKHEAPESALSELSAYEAWSHAATGNQRLCERALGRAEDHFDGSRDDNAPPWRKHFGYGELNGLRGHVYLVLADQVPSAAVNAALLLREAVDTRGPGYIRSKTLDLMGLSSTYFQRGDGIEEGVRIA
ncbi:MAG: helix-turn-helix domain-containing protein, partial [Stackebrandtia sp.]